MEKPFNDFALDDQRRPFGPLPADLNSINEFGMTPLMVAAQALDAQLFKDLITKDADPFKRSPRGDAIEFFVGIGFQNAPEKADAALAIGDILAAARAEKKPAEPTAKHIEAIETGDPTRLPMPIHIHSYDRSTFIAEALVRQFGGAPEALDAIRRSEQAKDDAIALGLGGKTRIPHAAAISALQLRDFQKNDLPLDLGRDWVLGVEMTAKTAAYSSTNGQPIKQLQDKTTVVVNSHLDLDEAAWLAARVAATPGAVVDSDRYIRDAEEKFFAGVVHLDLKPVLIRQDQLPQTSFSLNYRNDAGLHAILKELEIARDPFAGGRYFDEESAVRTTAREPAQPEYAPFYADIVAVRNEVARQSQSNKDTAIDTLLRRFHADIEDSIYTESLRRADRGEFTPAGGFAVVIDVPGLYNHLTEENSTRFVLAVGLEAPQATALAEIASLDAASFFKDATQPHTMARAAERFGGYSAYRIDLNQAAAADQTPLAAARYKGVDFDRIAVMSEVLYQGAASNEAATREHEARKDLDDPFVGPAAGAPAFFAAHAARGASR